MHIRLRSTVSALLAAAACSAVILAPDGVLADPPLQCTRATLGQLSCQAGVRCECSYRRDSAMTDRPGGFQWDCGINRPPCDQLPATLDPWPGPYPSAVGIDRTNIYRYPPDTSPSN